MSQKVILEIGPGDHPLPEATHYVEYGGHNPPEEGECILTRVYSCDWGIDSLPFADDEFDEVYASHVLEHVPWFRTHHALREVYRVLKIGGMFEVWVPDLDYLIYCFQNGICGDDWRKHNATGDPFVWFQGRMFTYGPEPNWHKACFNFEHLQKRLWAAKFVNVRRIERTRGRSHGKIDLGVIAYKGKDSIWQYAIDETMERKAKEGNET